MSTANQSPSQADGENHRARDIENFYALLNQLAEKIGGTRFLAQCHGRMGWPECGVYFFMEHGETRHASRQLRIVRVGTHRLTRKSKTALWTRLSNHRGGKRSGGGYHRSSVLRKLVGSALIQQHGLDFKTWGKDNFPSPSTLQSEAPLEQRVSAYIGNEMPFLWLAVADAAQRKFIEKNSIALLSNYRHQDAPIDPPSAKWLGASCAGEKVKKSGLWNQMHVKQNYEPEVLSAIQKLL